MDRNPTLQEKVISQIHRKSPYYLHRLSSWLIHTFFNLWQFFLQLIRDALGR